MSKDDFKVVSIDQAQVGSNVIKRLQETTELVQEGNAANIAIIIVNFDNSVMSCWANDNLPFTMVGGLENLKMDFMDANIEKR